MTTLNIKNQLHILEQLASKKTRSKILTQMDVNAMTALCDVVHNVLNGNINISDKDKKKLIKYKKSLRFICKHSSLDHKKKYLRQKGGFLQYLIPAVVTGLSSIISSYISKPDSQ
jgi:hypothetical protein